MAFAAVDTSVLVAGVLDWHEDHASCRAERARWERSKQKPRIPAHALVESYSVITRLPSGLRLRADDTLAVLGGAFGRFPVAPTPTDPWDLIEDFAEHDIVGGSAYDALILESAVAAGAKELITLDLQAFERLARGRIRVRSPRDG